MPVRADPEEGLQLAPPRRLSPWAMVLLSVAGFGGIFLVVAALFNLVWYVVFAPVKRVPRGDLCRTHLKQLVTALQMYANDYDERMPPASTWSQQLMPYVKDVTVYACPSRPGLSAGYAFNGKLDRRAYKHIAAPEKTPAIFESSLGVPNAWDHLQSFATPHNGVGIVAFANGHVKSYATAPAAAAGLARAGKQGKGRGN